MKAFRKISVLMLAVLMIFTMIACNNETAKTTEVTVTLNAYDINGDPVILGDITFESELPTVFEALEAICLDREFKLEADSNGIVSKINGVGGATFVDKETGVQMANGWMWTINGAEPTGFAKETAVKTGDVIEYREYSYENEAEELFGEDTTEEEPEDTAAPETTA